MQKVIVLVALHKHPAECAQMRARRVRACDHQSHLSRGLCSAAAAAAAEIKKRCHVVEEKEMNISGAFAVY